MPRHARIVLPNMPPNIREDEEEQFKKMAKHVLALSEAQLNALVSNGQFEEVESNDEEISK